MRERDREREGGRERGEREIYGKRERERWIWRDVYQERMIELARERE